MQLCYNDETEVRMSGSRDGSTRWITNEHFRIGAGTTPPLDLEGAHRRYLAALLGGGETDRICRRCGERVNVRLEPDRGFPGFPNRLVPLCRPCAKEHHDNWDEILADHHTERCDEG